MMKITFDDPGLFLRRPEICAHAGDHSLLCRGPASADRVALDVLVEVFVRVDLGAVAREKLQADALRVFRHETLYAPRAVDRMAIQDQKGLPSSLPDQPPKELQKNLSGEPILEDHEPQPSSIGDRADHVAPEP